MIIDSVKEGSYNNLLVKTRKNKSHIGKPRVYFCSTLKDQTTYFEEISDDILRIVNCSIWYKDSKKSSSTTDDMPFSGDFFSQIQLVVIPISENLLAGLEDSDIYLEFKTAIEKHVAILPIMMEDGLEGLYKSKLGDIQFIYKKKAENSQLTYEKVLERILT